MFPEDLPQAIMRQPETCSVPLHTSMFPTQVGIQPRASSNALLPLEPQQLPELAVLLGQHEQLCPEPALLTDGQNKLSKLLQIDNSPSLTPYSQASDPYSASSVVHMYLSLPNSSSSLGAQLNQGPQNQQPQSNVPTVHTVMASGQQNQQADTEADPQKRFQATLQRAATLLQQIQQRSKATKQP